jgi:PEP-CTERM motif
MKLFKLAPLILGVFALPALADNFSGAFDPSNWTVSNLGTLLGTATPASSSFSASSLSLTGGNSSLGCSGGVYSNYNGPCQIQATIAAPGSYSFNWSYLTGDGDGPGGDIFGVIVDGTRIQVSDLGGALTQGGTKTFDAQSSFGFFMNCTDCTGGSANAMVSNFAFAAAVPEPSTYALMLAGVAGIGAWRRVRRMRD